MSDSPEMAGISCGDKLGTYLGAGGAKCSVEVTEGFGSHMDPSSARTGVLSAGMDVNMTVNEAETISMRPIQLKLPKPPTGGENGHADETDGSRNHLSTSSTRTDTCTIGNEMETTTNAQEIVSMCLIESKLPNPLTRSANACANKSNGCGNPVETSTGYREVPSVETDRETTANVTETVRIPQIEPKMQNLPAGAERRCTGVADGFRSHADTLTTRKDTHTTANDAGTAENVSRNIRSRQNCPKTKSSPNVDGFATPKRADQQRWVSADGINVKLPLDEVLDTASRKIVFGRVESGDMVITPSVEGERAGDGDGDRDGDDSDSDGTTSGDGVDSTRVNAAQLAVGSQHLHQSRRTQTENLPASSRPSTYSAYSPYGHVRRCRRRGRIKFEAANVSIAQERKIAYWIRARAAQPPANALKCRREVYRPRRHRGCIKFELTNVKQMRISGNAYLTCVNAIQLTKKPKKHIRGSDKVTVECWMPGEPWREDGRLEIERISINQAGEDEITYRGRARLAQPPLNDSKHPYMVIGPRRRRGRIKSRPRNINQTEKVENAYPRRANVLPSIWRPGKQSKTISNLTFEFRMLGEYWCDVEDHG